MHVIASNSIYERADSGVLFKAQELSKMGIWGYNRVSLSLELPEWGCMFSGFWEYENLGE